MHRPRPHRRSRKIATSSPQTTPMSSVSHEMRRSVTAPGAASIAFGSIAASGQPSQNIPHTGKESQPAQDQHENGLRVQPAIQRSEEHTSELQSLAYLVCRLLLEKKKTDCHRLHSAMTGVYVRTAPS